MVFNDRTDTNQLASKGIPLPPSAVDLLFESLGKPLPIMNCERCLYMRLRGDEEKAEGLHCYMFREQPTGDRCAKMTDD